MPSKSKQRVAVEQLLVPARAKGGSWKWRPPSQVYLGEGWDSAPNISLLTAAFAARESSQLVQWQSFERRAIQLSKHVDKIWWLARMKDIGVWDCPQILRTPRRLAVAQSHSYDELTPCTWTPCPVPCPQGIWENYLRSACRRRANTKSGQEFYLEEVTWIDGLEAEECRPTIVEAMLRRPTLYERSTTTRLARYGGEDSTDVPSLWIYALRTEPWDVIPVSGGVRRPSEAWFLPLELRSTKADRFAFLPCVRSEFSQARELLKALSVDSLDEADIPRLLVALEQLGRRIHGAAPESLRNILALATDLYEAIQARLKAGESARHLSRLTEIALPLVQNERIASIRLGEIDRLVVDDDPIRRRHISSFDQSWVIPKRFHHTYNELIEVLREILGAEKIVRVSECALDVHFRPMEKPLLLLEYLRQQYPRRAVAEDIGLLIVKCGPRSTSPHDETFRQAWDQISRTRLIRGMFEGTTVTHGCFDAYRAEGPALMIDCNLEPHEIAGEIWQLVGNGYRHSFAAYAKALKDNSTDAFFVEQGVTSAERSEVESAVGLSFDRRLNRYQPVCFALWKQRNVGGSLAQFHSDWASRTHSPEAASLWLESPNLVLQVEAAIAQSEPSGSLSLLDAFSVTVEEWQAARKELGELPWHFDASERDYRAACPAVAGHIMSLFAYLVVPRASGASGITLPLELSSTVYQWSDAIRQMQPAEEALQRPLATRDVVACVAADAVRILPRFPELSQASVFSETLQKLAQTPCELGSIKLKDEPDKAATSFERETPEIRSHDAREAVDGLIKVASGLSVTRGESVAPVAIYQEPVVALLSEGNWANRVSVLAAARYALERLAPSTASRMKDRQAFRDVDDWRTLWKKFDELGDIPKPPVLPPEAPKYKLAGCIWTEEEFKKAAEAGPGSELAKRLELAVEGDLDLAKLRDISRGKVEAKARNKRGHRSMDRGKRQRIPDEYLTMLGAVGEQFVYQQLKASFPDFDLTNWKSRGREFFGHGLGDDSLGYDFEYYDVGGKLTGLSTPSRCLIEVKSAAQAFGSSFEMSTNEWEVALQCHEHCDAVYLIIRVAGTSVKPQIVDILLDPVRLHLEGVLDYSSRDLLVAVGEPAVGFEPTTC
jgi:hypothetical protein